MRRVDKEIMDRRCQRAHVLSLLKHGNIYKPACFITEKKIWYWRDANLGVSIWQFKQFYNGIYSDCCQSLQRWHLFLGLKHQCLNWEHGLWSIQYWEGIRGGGQKSIYKIYCLRIKLVSNYDFLVYRLTLILSKYLNKTKNLHMNCVMCPSTSILL